MQLGVGVEKLKRAQKDTKVGALDEEQVGAAEGTSLGTKLGP
jgi:hypothetical protein